MGSRILNVPYKSQNDADASAKRSDCGPCCIAMILGAIDKRVTTNEVTAASGVVGDSGLRLNEVVNAAKAFGLDMVVERDSTLDKLKRFIDNGQPPIALIKYGKIPDRRDPYAGGHFVVVVGYDDTAGRVFINDPDYPMGYQRPYSYQTFTGAWAGFEPDENPNFCLIVPKPQQPIPGQAISAPQPGSSTPQPAQPSTPTPTPGGASNVWVIAPAGLVFRTQPNASAQLIAGLPFGQGLTALGPVSGSDATGRTWQQIRTAAGLTGWVAASLGGDRLLSDKQPAAPFLVEVLDAQPVRDAGGLSVREKRDINLPALDRVKVGERLTVYGSLTQADGTVWLWVQSPRLHFGWAREKAGNVPLVRKVDLETGAAVDTSTPTPGPSAAPTPAPAGVGDVWVVAPAGLALRKQPSISTEVVAALPFGQHLTALGAASGSDATGRTWQQVRTETGLTGWAAASLGSDRYLANKQPDAPFSVQVLDTQSVRDAGGLSVREKRDINLQPLDRVKVGERLIVFGNIVESDGTSWLWAQSPRGQFGWAREKAGNVSLVRRVDQLGGASPTPTPAPTPRPRVDVRPFGKCLAGVGMGDPHSLTAGQLQLIAKSRIEAFKMLTLGDPEENKQLIRQLRNIRPDMLIVARLFFSVNHESQARFSAQTFVDTVLVGMQAAYDTGVRYFEVHNEPNLPEEGMDWNWSSGARFGDWLIEVLSILRPRFPEGKFGFPGLSPQPNAPDFLDGAAPAIARCDWVGAHSYWQTVAQITNDDHGMYWRRFRTRFPDKLLMITEFSNNARGVDPEEKGRQYADYYKLLRREPNLGAAFAFALSWPDQDKNREGWESVGQETAIPGVIGSRIGQPGFFA